MYNDGTEQYLNENPNTMYIVYYHLSKFVTDPLIKYTKVTANQVSLFAAFLVLIASGLFLTQTHWGYIAGAVVVQIILLLDYVDGMVARMRNHQSLTGKFLDMFAGYMREIFVPFSIAFALYQQTQDIKVWYFCYFFVAGSSVVRFVSSNMHLFTGSRKSINSLKKKSNFFVKQFINVTYTKYMIILIGAIANQMYWTLAVLAVYASLAGSAALYMVAKNSIAFDRSKENENTNE